MSSPLGYLRFETEVTVAYLVEYRKVEKETQPLMKFVKIPMKNGKTINTKAPDMILGARDVRLRNKYKMPSI